MQEFGEQAHWPLVEVQVHAIACLADWHWIDVLCDEEIKDGLSA